MIRVLHVAPSFYPAVYFGGPIYSVYHLCNELARCTSLRLTVLTTDTSGPSSGDRLPSMLYGSEQFVGYDVYFARKILATSFSLEFIRKVGPMVAEADVIHLTGVYSSTTIPTLAVTKLLGKPLVWSPRGAFQRWSGT